MRSLNDAMIHLVMVLGIVNLMADLEVKTLLFMNRNIDTLSSALLDRPTLDIMALLDQHSNTVLHQLAYQNHLLIIKLYIKHARQLLARYELNRHSNLYVADAQAAIISWVTKRNSEGFTAFLYACYSGHLDVIKYLHQQLGVNPCETTSNGLNALHLAAQNNKVLPFIYLQEKLSFSELDHSKSTPLHWAAYMNSEQVAAYILSSSTIRINAQDGDGQTPLMLATMSGNTRIVRRLLLKGADRYLRNKQNKSAVHVAEGSNFVTISNMLDEDYSVCDFVRLYCNIKIKYRPASRSMVYPIIFLICTLISLASLNALIELDFPYSTLCICLLFGAMLVIYATLLLPGKKPERKGYSEFMDEKRIKKVCFECQNLKPHRGYHCDVCHKCISQYDHHCTWINNCVGKHNIARFIIFLMFLVGSLATVGTLSALGIFVAFDACSLCDSWLNIRFPPQQEWQKWLIICPLGANVVISFFLFPVLMLLFVQVTNVLRNKTTYERIHGTEDTSSAKLKLKKHSGSSSIRNCRLMCAGHYSSLSSLTDSNLNTLRSEDP